MIFAFIDSQNLNLGVKKDVVNKRTGKKLYEGWTLHFGKFRIYLKDKYKVDEAFLFIGKVDGNDWLYEELKSFGYHLVFKPTTKYVDDDGKEIIKGNVDAELVLSVMVELNNFDKAVIVAGDGDYRCLVSYLVEKQKLQRLLVPNIFRTPDVFKEFSDYIDYVSPLIGKLKK